MSAPSQRILPWSIAMAFPLVSLFAAPAVAADGAAITLPTLTVSDSRTDNALWGAIELDRARLARRLASTSDTASLLGDVAGISLYGAGGVSSLPSLHGLADDRLRIKVDGMDLISACGNHMNPALSYIDPSQVGSIQVFTGITPVSAGGDAIGGSIQVSSQAPEFSKAGEGLLTKGQAGAFYRSNGNGRGGHVSATVATEAFSLRYNAASAESGNYEAAQNFKWAISAPSGVAIPGLREVGSSQYRSRNQSLDLALRSDDHLLELKLGRQDIPYQGFPNQRMDMTRNASDQVNLRYLGQTQWGAVEARLYREATRHTMNFLDNKLSAIGARGMPMDTEGQNTGAAVKADVLLSQRDSMKVGAEWQRYRLNDWWDPVSAVPGMMAPNPFWNVRDGQRDRQDVFAEWEARWSTPWLSQIGVRRSSMTMNTGKVQGYNAMAGMMGYGDPANPASVPGAFNALDRNKTDANWDLSALARYTPDAQTRFEAGYSRKARSPSLYERYTWSTNNNMVMNMINWVGDANGYVGNISLRPEVAHTVSATADWHAADRQQWGLQATAYSTYVEDYIDAVGCATVGKVCPARTDKFVNLSFGNQSARIHGADLSGYTTLAQTQAYGSFTATGLVSVVKGRNASTDDALYNTMPLNAKLALVQRAGGWTNTVEAQWVDAKSDVSKVRNEIRTEAYSLLNLRSSYEWKQARFDIGIDNLLERFYTPPLGGAYVGQRGSVWGIAVPGAGRSINVGMTVKF